MPLNSGCSLRAFRDNIAKMIREGRPRDQAVAAAISALRQGCKQRGKPMPDIGEIVPAAEIDEEIIKIILAALKEEQAGRQTTVWGLYDYFPKED